MPEPDFNEIPERYRPVIAQMAYANKDFEEEFPGDYQLSGGSTVVFWEPPTVDARYIKSPFVNQEQLSTPLTLLLGTQATIIQSDLLKTEEEQLQEAIFYIKRLISIPYKDKLADMLLTLFYDAKEEDPDSLGISVRSLQHFTNFLLLHSNLKCPTISLTPDYNIYASWRYKNNLLFSVHFLPNGDTRFVIFKPNHRHPERKTRISGVATVDVLMDTVMPNRIEEWILQ